MKKLLQVGDIITLHQLGCNTGWADYVFKVKGGRVAYDAIDYPNRASGWWVTVSRMTPNGCKARRLHTDTEVEILEINNPSQYR